MSKVVKQMLMDEILDRVGEARDMLVVDSSRLDAVTDNRFRLALQEKNITTLTVRNSLAKRAFNSLDFKALNPVLEGPSTLIFGGEDVVALSKEIAKWAKELGPLEIKGGAVEGESLDADGVDQLSKSPSREELIGQIAGLILSPGARLAAALLGPGGKIAGQVTKISEGDGE